MDASWQPAQGSNPPAGVDPNAPAAAAGSDWRAQVSLEARSGIVNRILQSLRKHLPVSVPEGLDELQKIAVRFEEKIYNAATSQSDYLRKISAKLLSMEPKTQQTPGNALVNRLLSMETKRQQAPGNALVNTNQNIPNQGIQPAADVDPNATATAGGDWRAQLDLESRSKIINRILESLRKHLPVPVPEGLNEIQKIAVRFEEKIYNAATSQSDYLRKIYAKLLSMEPKTQQTPGNSLVNPNRNIPNQDDHVDGTNSQSQVCGTKRLVVLNKRTKVVAAICRRYSDSCGHCLAFEKYL